MTDQEKIAALEAQLGMVAECYRHAMDTYDDLFEYGLDAILSTVKKPLAVKDVVYSHYGDLDIMESFEGEPLTHATFVLIEKEGE